MSLWDKIRNIIDECAKLAEACGRPIEVLDGITISEVYAAMQLSAGCTHPKIELEVESPYSKSSDEPPDVTWKLWDGKKYFKGNTLKSAFAAFQEFHKQPEEPEGQELAAADVAAVAPKEPF